jgi:hypothetical protein
LNLTFANRVFLVEPQWNPSVESQAIARAQRIGQHQTVEVIRYMIQRTIEQVRDADAVKHHCLLTFAGNGFSAEGQIENGGAW